MEHGEKHVTFLNIREKLQLKRKEGGECAHKSDGHTQSSWVKWFKALRINKNETNQQLTDHINQQGGWMEMSVA